MIDSLDKQTQPMDLEHKRGRGRPATGKALSNADRQRAYRERQKAQRNEMERELHNAEATLRVDENYTETVWQELEQAKARIVELEKELASRNEKQPSRGKTWTLQARSGSGKWLTLAYGLDREEASRQLDRVIDNKILGATKGRQYRIVEE